MMSSRDNSMKTMNGLQYSHCFVFVLFLWTGFLWPTTFARDGYLYVSNGSHILRMSQHRDIGQEYETVYHQIGGKITGLAADVDDGLLFWADIGRTQNAIFRSELDGSRVNIIVTGVIECYAVSVDWVSKHIYWTSGADRTVEIANYDGSGRRILIGQGLSNPRGIVVDPVFRNVFWADQGSKTIERSWLDGSNRKVLVDRDISWPNQITFSYPTRRLYWIDSKRQEIVSCDVEGDDVTVEGRVVEVSQGNPVYGIVVVGNKAFISTWFNASISSTLVGVPENFWRQEVRFPNSLELYSLMSTVPTMQPQSSHPCGQPDRGGCTHLCLPTQGGLWPYFVPSRGPDYECACPSYGGLALSFNAKTCEAPSEPLFFTLKDWGQVGFISLSGAQSSYLTMVGRSTKPNAVTYDPIKQVVYWSDVAEGTIYRSALAGHGDKEIFLNGSHGIGIVEGLALDWKSRHLYYTNSGESAPGLDGAVYSWHRIERISLDGKDRKMVVGAVQRPAGVVLDLDNGYLYFSDWGDQPRIVRVLLDGSDPTTLLDQGLHKPTGLSLYKGSLYVADSYRDNKTGIPHLMVFDGDTSQWTQLKLSSNVSLPVGLAVRGDTMYYTDWVSQDNHVGYIKSYNLRFGVDNNLILNGGKPTGLHYSPLARRKTESDNEACSQSSCSHSCIQLPEENAYRCGCPDLSPRILAKDAFTCQRPTNFLLVADLNTIKMTSLDPGTQETEQTLWYSDVTANFVALTYDESTDVIYWSDLTRRSIYSSPVTDFMPQPLIQVDHYIDGLALETKKQRLYWTGYSGNGSGVIARLSIQRGVASYHEILRGLNNPRAIHVYAQKKLLFWTEYGGKKSPACVKRSRVNGRNPKILMSNRLFWPNALTTHKNKLYIADGAGQAFVMDFHGNDIQELTFMSGSTKHIFGLVVMDTVLFYSDWFTNSVYMVDTVTGHKETVMSHLSRPTNIFVHHPSNLSEDNLCLTEGAKCTESCVPVPRSYHCTCSIGSKLAADGFSCIKMTSPWQVTDESKCYNQCDQNAYCSQLVPLLKYQCVCKSGYENLEGSGYKCSACGQDFFKPLLGNDTCVPCPIGSTTLGSKTASQCTCDNPQHRLVNGLCTDVTTTTSSTTTTTSDGESVPLATSDTGVDGYQEGQTTDQSPVDSTIILPKGQPYYENCPNGETVRMKLSETQSHVWLPVDWVARDSFGTSLTSISNIEQQDNKIMISWKANGDAGIHTVIFEATDDWKQTVTCQFQILVEDLVPPIFTSCPSNIYQETFMKSEPISWALPVATDNVNAPRLHSNYEPRSEFGIGTTHVRYEAFDSAGNMAICSFNVTLVEAELPCNLTTIQHGGFLCNPTESEMCHIVCHRGYTLNPAGRYPSAFNCTHESSVKAMDRLVAAQQPCLSHPQPSSAVEEFMVTVEGHCDPDDADLKRKLRSKIIDKLTKRDLCLGAECSHGAISILCLPRRQKKKRYLQQTFNMTWPVVITLMDGLSRGKVKTIISNLEQELWKLTIHVSFYKNPYQYRVLPGTVATRNFRWICPEGHMTKDDGCVACTHGSYFNRTLSTCLLCDKGTYQNSSSQEACLQCNWGTTEEEGATSLSQCVSFTSMNRMTKLFIIAACSFAFVFLCFVIIMIMHCKSQQKKAKATSSPANNSKYPSPNVYAQPPNPSKQNCPDYIRSSKDFFVNNHDYEDLDGQHRSTFETFSRRPPGCRDSLSSFKAPSDVSFLPPSPQDPHNHSSFLTNDALCMPGSPRDNTKALSIHGESFQYNSLGSFKGSPPPSPFRSLHMAANGPIPRGIPESPTHKSQTLNSLFGEESPYTSRLIRDRLIDPDSPYRIISSDRRTPVPPESPYKKPHRLENNDSPYRMTSDYGSMNRMSGKESPYRSPILNGDPLHSYKTTPEMHRAHTHGFPSHMTTDHQNSLRSVPESPHTLHHQPLFCSTDDSPHTSLPSASVSAFDPVGDFLYKRPPSPLSPPLSVSAKKSNDSLSGGSSSAFPPATSPGVSSKHMNFHRTPPQKRRAKKNELGIYQYD